MSHQLCVFDFNCRISIQVVKQEPMTSVLKCEDEIQQQCFEYSYQIIRKYNIFLKNTFLVTAISYGAVIALK